MLVRQRPGKGNAVFITIEDETGIVNALMWARDFEAQRATVMAARLMVIEGVVQRSKEDVVHLMASRVTDETALLDQPDNAAPETRRDASPAPGMARAQDTPAMPPSPRPPPLRARHPRDARILPRSRDFH